MKIWVDADACPGVIKAILCKAAQRTQTPTIFLANHVIRVPVNDYVRFFQVESGFDVVDNAILKRMQSGDGVITSDIPLAAAVIEQHGWVLSPRGESYTQSNIQQRLAMRHFMNDLRESGVATGRQAPLSQTDRHAFASQLDARLLHI